MNNFSMLKSYSHFKISSAVSKHGSGKLVDSIDLKSVFSAASYRDVDVEVIPAVNRGCLVRCDVQMNKKLNINVQVECEKLTDGSYRNRVTLRQVDTGIDEKILDGSLPIKLPLDNQKVKEWHQVLAKQDEVAGIDALLPFKLTVYREGPSDNNRNPLVELQTAKGNVVQDSSERCTAASIRQLADHFFIRRYRNAEFGASFM